MTLLAQMSWIQSLLTVLLITICCLLMLVILVQKGRGEGLTGAFGGAGGSSAFGAKTGDVFTWITVVVAVLFLLVSVIANYAFDQSPKPRATVVAPATTPESPSGGPETALPAEPRIPQPAGETTTTAGETESAPTQDPQESEDASSEPTDSSSEGSEDQSNP